jgi:hypothetical protein
VVADHLLLVAGVTFLLVITQGRFRLAWTDRLPFGPVVRRLLRLLVFCAPMLVLGLPSGYLPAWGAAFAACAGAAPLLLETRNLRLSFRPGGGVLSPIGGQDRFRDLMFFGFAGLCQEYLYRYLFMTALAPIVGAVSVPIAALLFALEHQFQMGARRVWDRHDVLVHVYLGLALGFIAYASGSWLVAALGHTVYNLPKFLWTLVRPRISLAAAGMVLK